MTLPIGKQNGIDVTTNPGLNKVFRNNQVYNYFQAYPAYGYQFMLALYVLACNCDEHLLKDTLENALFYAYAQINKSRGDLNTRPALESVELKLYPLPFATRLNFEYKDQVEKAEIVDLAGKVMCRKVNPPGTLDLSSLKAGQYSLLLTSKILLTSKN
jgi:hypothetical protein